LTISYLANQLWSERKREKEEIEKKEEFGRRVLKSEKDV
jgi:hypothetical protein